MLRARKPREALAAIIGTQWLRPNDPRRLARVAVARAMLGEFGLAIEAAKAALERTGDDLETLDLIGNSLTLAHQPASAYAAFERASRLAPGDPAILFNLAASARFIGKLQVAEEAYDRLLEEAPDTWEAHYNRSHLRRQTASRNHLQVLRAAAGTPGLPWMAQVKLAYALGKELEDLEAYDEAFAAFAHGAQIRRHHMTYDVGADIQTMTTIAETFDAEWCAPARSFALGAGPIFILGLPRTGSTLLEQMLGRHSQVQALGELQAFGGAVMQSLAASGPAVGAGRLDVIRATAGLPPDMIGEAYLSKVAPLRNDQPHFVDKLPFNALYAGLIARALPTARIIHLTRDGADACVAMFKALFEEAYPYSYDLAELAAYHNAHGDLMAHWREALGPRLIEIDYESLVGEPAIALPRLLQRLGLAMEADCLAPEASTAASMTASASQVRAPVHTRSVRISQKYAAHIAGLTGALQAHDAEVRP